MNINYKTRFLVALLIFLIGTSAQSVENSMATINSAAAYSITERNNRDQQLSKTHLEIYFDRNSAKVSETDKNRIAAIAELMLLNSKATLHIQGYTDSKGGQRYNRELSQQRVENVHYWLQQYWSLQTTQLDVSERIETTAHGETYAEGENALLPHERKVVLSLSVTNSPAELLQMTGTQISHAGSAIGDRNVNERYAVLIEYERKLPQALAPPYEFFDYKSVNELSDRMYIDDREGKIYFKVKQGSLQSNIKALMRETRDCQRLVWKVGAHRVFADYWVSGESMFDVANKMLSPYKEPSQLELGAFVDGTLSVFYDTDSNFWQ